MVEKIRVQVLCADPQHAILMNEVVDGMTGLREACVITDPAYFNVLHCSRQESW